LRACDSMLIRDAVDRVVDSLKPRFLGKDYHLLEKNCNSFSDALARALVRSARGTRFSRRGPSLHVISDPPPTRRWATAFPRT
jgi:hypothetical protein